MTVNKRARVHKEKLDVFEAKIEESEKAGSRRESHPGHLACVASALPLSYDNQTTTSPHNPLFCTGGTEVPQSPPGSHSVCAIRTLLGADQKILTINSEPILSGFLGLNVLHVGIKRTYSAPEQVSQLLKIFIESFLSSKRV